MPVPDELTIGTVQFEKTAMAMLHSKRAHLTLHEESGWPYGSNFSWTCLYETGDGGWSIGRGSNPLEAVRKMLTALGEYAKSSLKNAEAALAEVHKLHAEYEEMKAALLHGAEDE
jgi:hypothetical protein